MKYDQHLVTQSWADYELVDSGANMKLERFGQVIMSRPETQALWPKSKPDVWKIAQAVFESGDGKGSWKAKNATPESWEMARGPIHFIAKLTGFKHTGVFPEQEPNWVWIKDQVKALTEQDRAVRSRLGTVSEGGEETRGPAVLNLFGYTGIATLAAAHPGATVTHVDASKQSLDWAHENARLTGIGEDKIRWILDDALAFAKREARREAKYDGIILDPPAFGRGAKSEVWKVEESLPNLLEVLKPLLKDAPGSFFLLNGYAAGYASRSFAQAVDAVFAPANAESGELHIRESGSERVVPSGIYVRFVR